MSGFTIYCNFTDPDVSMTFMSVNLIQNYNIEISDWEFRGSGMTLNTETPLNLLVKNTDIDYYNMNQGFNMAINWNCTEAITTNKIIFDNVTVYNSPEKDVAVENLFIYFGGASNVTVVTVILMHVVFQHNSFIR